MSGLEKALFNLKFTSKQLQRQAARAQADSKKEERKLAKALQEDQEIARLVATNVIRKKQERLNLLRLSARIDAVASRVQTAVTMRQVTGQMAQTVRGMDSALKNMDPEKIEQVLDKFKAQFEDMDVVSSSYEGMASGVESQTVGVQGQSEVDALLNRVADENGLELKQNLQEVPDEPVKTGGIEQKQLEEGLGDRLRALRAE